MKKDKKRNLRKLETKGIIRLHRLHVPKPSIANLYDISISTVHKVLRQNGISIKIIHTKPILTYSCPACFADVTAAAHHCNKCNVNFYTPILNVTGA